MAPARYRTFTLASWQSFSSLPAAALRLVLREGYDGAKLKADILAGMVVGVVAVPLAMALSIAIGAPPQAGLITAVVGGFSIALLGGSRTQVSGPTAAFIVVLAPIYTRFGMGGLLVSGLLGGAMLVALGVLRLGKLIEYIPYPVTTGFTAGIATVIAVLQLKDALGLRPASAPDAFIERVVALFEARETFAWPELCVAVLTLLLLLSLPRLTRRVPAPLLALPLAAVAAALLTRLIPGMEVATLGGRFQMALGPPAPMLPWSAPGPSGVPLAFDLATMRALLPGAFAIAMLGAIESLLSAVVADGMARTKHDPDAELFAQGVGNILTPFFGGIPATGAIARTATNVRSGATSPIAAMTHAVVVLAAMVVMAPLLAHLPMAALAALLLLVAWNMSDLKHVGHILRVAPKSDVAVLVICYGLTVVTDMVIAVGVGVVLAAFLFMRRMVEVTRASTLDAATWREDPSRADLPRSPPSGVIVYDIAGPLFFGAAAKAMATLGTVAEKTTRVVILRLEQVPAMDVTGLVALETALDRLAAARCVAILVGAQPQPAEVLANARIRERKGRVELCESIDDALSVAEGLVAAGPTRPLEAPGGGSHAVAGPDSGVPARPR